MNYADEPQPELTEKSKTIALLRQALAPLIKDKATNGDLDNLSKAIYTEMAQMGERIEKKLADNKPADVDMSPIAELLLSVTELQKREIKNEVVVDMQPFAELTQKVADAVDFMMKSTEEQTQFMKNYTAPKATPAKLTEVKITNFDDFKNVGQTQSVFTSKFPFLPSSGLGNVALRLVRSTTKLDLDAMPIVNPDGSDVNSEKTFATRIDNTVSGILYIGKAAIASSTSQAVWQIEKLDTSSGLIKTWANGSDTFTNVWDDRASLTYL